MSKTTLSIPEVADYDILVNGSALSAKYKSHILSITVETHTRWPGMFEIVIGASNYLSNETEWVDDSVAFSVGNEIEIKMGYVDKLQTVLTGEITGLEPEFTAGALPRLIVCGYDRGHRLHGNRKTRTFTQQKDSDIASTIAQEIGLTSEVTDSQVTHDYVCQAQQTDMEFLLQRADRINYELIVEAKKLIFRPVQNASSEIATLDMLYDLLEFYPRLSTIGLSAGLEVRSWSPKDKTEITAKAASGDETSSMSGASSCSQIVNNAFGDSLKLICDEPVATQAEADQIAKARFNTAALSLITGEGVCIGRNDLTAGKVIKIDGVGTRFSGKYYLTSTSQRLRTQKNFVTHFCFRRSGS